MSRLTLLRSVAASCGLSILLTACASQPRPTSLALAQRVEHIDGIGREPMVVEHPNGALFVAAYGEPHAVLWKSADHGATWSRVGLGPEADGALGNSDVDLAVARDGTLYLISMLFDRSVGEGRRMAVAVSADAGDSWHWTVISQNRFDDRPWIDVAPDGTAHAIWNDGSGVSHAVSRDRGHTWIQLGRVHDHGGSSHLAIGPSGELAVRITPASASGNRFDEGVDLIAISVDGGQTWQTHIAPGERDWFKDDETPGATPRWVEPLAFDAEGNLYSLWADHHGLQLARSSDRGAKWTTWQVLRTTAQAFFPYLTARGHGELAATWFTSSTPGFSDLEWHVARISIAAIDAAPRMSLSPARMLESARPRFGHGDMIYNDTGGEYLAVTFLRDGGIGVVSPIQNKPAQRTGFTWWRFEEK